MIVKLFSVLFAIIITLHSQQNVTFYISIVEHIASMHGKNATPHVHQHVSINAYKKLRSKKQNSHGNLPKHSHDLELVSLDMPSLKLELTCEIINHCRYTVIHNTFRHITSTYLHQYTLEIFRPPVA